MKEKITNTFNNLLKNTENEELKKNILSATSNFDKYEVLKNLKTNPNQAKLFEILLSKTKHNDNEITEFISTILNSKNIEPDMFRTAVWGAGRYKNDTNFKIIKNIALNKNESDIRKREFAIQSVALYLKDKPDEVKEVIRDIKNEDSIYKTLGKILNDKINGNYHGQKNRELNYLNYDEKQIEEFRQICDRFYETEKPLNLQQENACHRSILYFKNILGKLINDGYKYILQQDTFTKQAPNFVGQRYINSRAGIYNSGDFYDAFDGIKTDSYNMMNYYRVIDSNHTNVMAHETAHTLNEFFTKKDLQELDKLYKKAEKNNLFLDSYAAANNREYFAQGCMAFATHYLPHKTLLNSFDHTRFELMTKDPELYKFVKRVIKKYH